VFDAGWRQYAGAPLAAVLFAVSASLAVYHTLAHDGSLLVTILGQWSLLAASLLFGVICWYCLGQLDRPRRRGAVGIHAAGFYALAGVAASGYFLHRHFSPATDVPLEGVLYEGLFVALIAGSAGAVVGLEVTRRDRAVSDLQGERDRFSSLFQNVPSPAIEFRHEGDETRVVRANDAFVETFGVEPPVSMATFNETIASLEGSEEAEALAVRARAGERIEQRVQRETVEGRRWFELRANSHEDGGFAIYLDVTMRHLRGQQLQVLTRVLRHNLRNKLGIVRGYADQIRTRTDRDDVTDAAEQVRESAQQLLDIGQSVRTIRSELTENPPIPEPTNVAAVVRDAVADARSDYPDVTFDVDAPPESRAMAQDILAVALDAMFGVLLTHNERDAPRIEVTVESVPGEEGDHVRVSVTDNGDGLPEHELIPVRSATEPTQLEHAADIDLWMANWFVGQFGGVLHARESETGATRFEVKLPGTERPSP
jgi:signal transduction histidine kinase